MASLPDSPNLNGPPPAYDSIHVDRRLSLSTSPSPSQPSPTQAPAAPSLLPLTIPTKKYPLSSGFPYHSTVFHLGISPDVWTRFSDEIVQATKLSLTQQSLAWTSGISVGLVSVAAVPPFGAAAGVFAGKAVYDKTVLSNVKQGLEQGKLGDVLKRWNEDCWREKGVVAKLVVKENKQSAHDDRNFPSPDSQKKKDKKKDQRKEAGRFELVLESTDAMTCSANNASANSGVETTVEIEGTPTNAVPIELDDSLPPELPPRPSELPMPTPELADEKAAVADTARLSWTSGHPSESRHPPRNSLMQENAAREGTDEDLSPVSDVSRWSFAPRDPMSQDVEVSPVSESAGRRSYEHAFTPLDASLAPAPLFAR